MVLFYIFYFFVETVFLLTLSIYSFVSGMFVIVQWHIFYDHAFKSLSDNFNICVILLLRLLIFFAHSSCDFPCSCYHEWLFSLYPKYFRYYEILDITSSVLVGLFRHCTSMAGKGGTTSLLPCGSGSPGSPRSLPHVLLSLVRLPCSLHISESSCLLYIYI